MPFSRELWIEKSDFAIVPPPKFKRLKPDGEVRLMGAYIVKCNEVITDDNGEVVEIHCTADLETGNGNPVDGRKVRGNIHWVSAKHAVDADLNLFDNLFTLENTGFRAGRHQLSGLPESGIQEGSDRMQAGAVGQGRAGRHPYAVCPHGLLYAGHQAVGKWRSELQSHCFAEG